MHPRSTHSIDRSVLPTLALVLAATGLLAGGCKPAEDPTATQDPLDASLDTAPDADAMTELIEATDPLLECLSDGCGEPYREVCEWLEWLGPEDEVSVHTCTKSLVDEDQYDCQCDGVVVTLAADTCDAALLEGCGVDTASRRFCQSGTLGTCWPSGDEEGWSCLCRDDLSTTEQSIPQCEDALFSQCAETCDSFWGSCVPSQENGMFDCSCSYYGAQRLLYGSTCSTALAACDPQMRAYSRNACGNWGGFCDGESSSWSCHCLDGSSQQSDMQAGDETFECDDTVAEICGDPAPPPELACEGTQGTGEDGRWGSCIRVRLADGETLGFRCYCVDEDSSDWESVVPGDDCLVALEAVCLL